MPKTKKIEPPVSSGLYGIKNSNRSADKHWGKNSFNSSFPTALACYMLSKDIPAIYNRLVLENGELKVSASEISLKDVFACGDKTFEVIWIGKSRYSCKQFGKRKDNLQSLPIMLLILLFGVIMLFRDYF